VLPANLYQEEAWRCNGYLYSFKANLESLRYHTSSFSEGGIAVSGKSLQAVCACRDIQLSRFFTYNFILDFASGKVFLDTCPASHL
jgi:hypothetical protein